MGSSALKCAYQQLFDCACERPSGIAWAVHLPISSGDPLQNKKQVGGDEKSIKKLRAWPMISSHCYYMPGNYCGMCIQETVETAHWQSLVIETFPWKRSRHFTFVDLREQNQLCVCPMTHTYFSTVSTLQKQPKWVNAKQTNNHPIRKHSIFRRYVSSILYTTVEHL